MDIKIIAEDRDGVRMHYHGKMKSNIVPNLKLKTISDNLSIELKNPPENNYAVTRSDVVLEIFVPKSFNDDFDISTSSGDIYMENLIEKGFNIASSSGDLELENEKGSFKATIGSGEKSIDINTSSGSTNFSKR